MANKVGKLIKEARTAAGLTQEQLAKKAKEGLTAADVSKAERGERKLTEAQLKAIAKTTGVTRKSLIEAAASSSYKSSAAKASGKTSSSSSSSSSGTAMKLTAAEKKLVEYYRKADASAKKQAAELLKSSAEDDGGLLGSLLGGKGNSIKDIFLDAAKDFLKESMK